MLVLLIAAAACIAFWSNSAQAGPNCVLMTSDPAMRDCFDRTFSTAPKPEPTMVPQSAKSSPKLASPPKTQRASEGSPE